MVVTCMLCNKKFTTQSNINKHLRNVHKKEERNIISYNYNFSNIKCLSCLFSFRFTSDLRYHLKYTRNEVIAEEKLQFANGIDFQCWLNDLHKSINVEYVKRELKGKLYYNCNRSGQYSVKKNECRKRALKTQGSCKLGYMCTSEIIVSIEDDCVYDVTYYKSHYGHKLELQHIRLPKHVRSNIAAKLTTGVTISKDNGEYNRRRRFFGAY